MVFVLFRKINLTNEHGCARCASVGNTNIAPWAFNYVAFFLTTFGSEG
jgi:hypothetical protein